MARDVLIHEAARARLRPFAVAAARRAVRRAGPAALRDPRVIGKAIKAATAAAVRGQLPDGGTMSRRQMEAELQGIFLANASGLGDLGGWFKSLRKSIKEVGRNIDDGAHKIASKIEDVHKEVFREVIIPVTAPTIDYNLDKRDDYKALAAAALARWEASGRTDTAAYQEAQNYTAMADKRLEKVQDTVKAATAVVGAVVLAPLVAPTLAKIGAGEVIAEAVTDTAKDAAATAVASEVAKAIAPEAEQALVDYQETVEELAKADAELAEQEPAPAKAGSALAWLLPAAGALLMVAS